jgi:hypothetical protein
VRDGGTWEDVTPSGKRTAALIGSEGFGPYRKQTNGWQRPGAGNDWLFDPYYGHERAATSSMCICKQ